MALAALLSLAAASQSPTGTMPIEKSGKPLVSGMFGSMEKLMSSGSGRDPQMEKVVNFMYDAESKHSSISRDADEAAPGMGEQLSSNTKSAPTTYAQSSKPLKIASLYDFVNADVMTINAYVDMGTKAANDLQAGTIDMNATQAEFEALNAKTEQTFHDVKPEDLAPLKLSAGKSADGGFASPELVVPGVSYTGSDAAVVQEESSTALIGGDFTGGAMDGVSDHAKAKFGDKMSGGFPGAPGAASLRASPQAADHGASQHEVLVGTVALVGLLIAGAAALVIRRARALKEEEGRYLPQQDEDEVAV